MEKKNSFYKTIHVFQRLKVLAHFFTSYQVLEDIIHSEGDTFSRNPKTRQFVSKTPVIEAIFS